jgi:hypothetical protein
MRFFRGVQSASGSKSSPVSSRRSYSQDSVTQAANAVEKSRRGGKSKKGSSHADVIDRLDYTSVGPSELPLRTTPLHFVPYMLCNFPVSDYITMQCYTTTVLSTPVCPLATVTRRRPQCWRGQRHQMNTRTHPLQPNSVPFNRTGVRPPSTK